MPYQFQPRKPYMMPTNFGPRPYKRGSTGTDNVTGVQVSFLTKKEQLEEFLPEGFAVRGDPVMTVSISILGQVGWLAGHGYNIISTSIPVVFKGKENYAVGNFTPAVWENQADAIIQGREIYGMAKLYADILAPSIYQNELHVTGSWMGFKFVDISVKNLTPLSAEDIEALAASRQVHAPEGVLTGGMNYKYIPKTGTTEPDVSYVVLVAGGEPAPIKEAWRGEGRVQFHEATWEELPTMIHVVNALCKLEIKEYRDAVVTLSGSSGAGAEVPGRNPFHILR